jgi:glycosyltransferase involved in cell wall biosynthesis
MALTAVILTKNEEENIKDCIRTLAFCDEVLVVDDNSIDRTVEISLELGAKVINHHLNSNFAKQRNLALSQAMGEWVIFLDADERISKELATEITQNVKGSLYGGFLIPRQDVWLGKKMLGGEFGGIKLLRLGKRDAGRWKRAVHEYWDIKDEIVELQNKIEHYPHQNITDFLKHINYYSQIHSKENYKEGKSASFWQILCYPLAKFVRNFLLKSGYRDGTHGFVAAVLMSFHSFLSWSILWCQQKKIKYYH